MNSRSNIHYYFKDGFKTDSKIIALEQEQIKKEVCKVYYHDNIYSSIDWSAEPPHSLEYYYLEQAKKIRDEYDYVILAYSGGIDSTCILETFYYNNINIDKIVTVGALSQDKGIGDNANRNGDLYFNVFPTIKKLKLEDKLQVLDHSTYFSNPKNFEVLSGSPWIEKMGNWISPSNFFWRDIHRYIVPDEMKNKKVAYILGKDKPLINKDDRGYYFNFADAILNDFGFFKGTDNVDVIHFYWDPGFTPIILKQLHMLKNLVIIKNKIPDIYNSNIFIARDDICNLIYDLKNPLSFISKKAVSTVISPRDSFIINKKNSDIFEIFSTGLKEIKYRLGNLPSVFPIRYSERYYL